MYESPGYLWAITLAGVVGVLAATCAALYAGSVRAGYSRARATLLAAAAAAVTGGWLAASALIADHGWYRTRLGHGVPWLPVAVLGYLGLLLALRQIPAVSRSLAAPGMTSRLELPHTFRVAGVAFLITMGLGHLPALFALPAGLGDIATGIAAPLVALRLARGRGLRVARWLNAFGLADLGLALVLGALTGYQLIDVHPPTTAISALPIALIPTAEVPLLIVLHLTSMAALARSRRTPRQAGVLLTTAG